MANKYDRVVLLIDMDCFYCQVEGEHFELNSVNFIYTHT